MTIQKTALKKTRADWLNIVFYLTIRLIALDFYEVLQSTTKFSPMLIVFMSQNYRSDGFSLEI